MRPIRPLPPREEEWKQEVADLRQQLQRERSYGDAAVRDSIKIRDSLNTLQALHIAARELLEDLDEAGVLNLYENTDSPAGASIRRMRALLPGPSEVTA